MSTSYDRWIFYSFVSTFSLESWQQLEYRTIHSLILVVFGLEIQEFVSPVLFGISILIETQIATYGVSESAKLNY